MKVLFYFAVLLATLSALALTGIEALGNGNNIQKRISGCGGRQANQYPVYTGEPKLLKSCKNGKLFQAGDATLNQSFQILHVWGTPTEQGTAYGTLLKDEIPQNYQNLLAYIEGMIEKSVSWLPKWIVDIVVDKGVPYLLELTFNGTRRFTPDAYIEEIDAIAAASGFSKALLRGVSQLPEAIEAQCTIIGAQGKSTPDNCLAHARFLDFGNAKIKDLPLVTVYHNEGETNDEINFGWAVFTGLLTGASRVKATNTVFSLGEKVWDAGSVWTAGVFGEPWTFMTRDVMRKSSNMLDAIRILAEGKRTCRIWLGIGHQAAADASQFRIFSVDKDIMDVYTWQNFSTWPAHPTLESVGYIDKHMQPSNNPCLGTLLKQNWGNLTAEFLATHVASYEQSGDIHAATWDDQKQVSYFSIMKKSFDTGPMPENSYDRPWTKLDMAKLFAEQPPAL